jgi:hypothetical protein
MEEQKTGLGSEFQGNATPPQEQVTVSLQLDADLLAWLKQEPLGWQREINNAVRFIMDMSNMVAPPPLDDDLEPVFEETAGPDPARNADKIAHDFVP